MNSKWIDIKAGDGGSFKGYLSLPPLGKGRAVGRGVNGKRPAARHERATGRPSPPNPRAGTHHPTPSAPRKTLQIRTARRLPTGRRGRTIGVGFAAGSKPSAFGSGWWSYSRGVLPARPPGAHGRTPPCLPLRRSNRSSASATA
mgnify:CR=1 FL=1